MYIKDFMSRPKRITAFSEVGSADGGDGCAVVMIGSYAPVYRGHFDAIGAAATALTAIDRPVGALVFVPNSEDYVRGKLGPNTQWTFGRRVKEILTSDPHPTIPTYVDDVLGSRYSGILNNRVGSSVEEHLGLAASQTLLVVGSDQLPSLEEYLGDDNSHAVCVLRPSHLDDMDRLRSLDWVSNAEALGRLVVTTRADMWNDYSSSQIRATAP